MELDSKEVNSNEAKLILISILGTVFVLSSLFYLFRVEIVSYFFRSIESDISRMIPGQSDFVTDEERVVDAIAAVNPSVVSVIVTKDVPVFEQYYEIVNPWNVAEGFSVPRIRENGTEEKEVGGGSGFIVSSDGLIVTNRHVIEDKEARYSVVMFDGSIYDVSIVDRDPVLDIAVLKIVELPLKKLTFVNFGSSDSLELGQTVIVIGNALAEFQNSVSLGIVSGLGRSVVANDLVGKSEQLNEVIQTDAAINSGNSGGPLLNLNGEVIGVTVATSIDADNIGFALPSKIVEQVVDSVREHGEIVRPFLGVHYVMVNEEISEDHGLDVVYGALIVEGSDGSNSVLYDSPAYFAGLQTGDVILSIDDVSLRGRDLAVYLRSKVVGEEVKLLISREGIEELVLVILDRAL